MKASKSTLAICSVTAAIGVLAWGTSNDAPSLPPSGLCTVGVGSGVPRGTVVEICRMLPTEALSSMPGLSQTPPQSIHQDLMVAISSLNTHRILTINGLRLLMR